MYNNSYVFALSCCLSKVSGGTTSATDSTALSVDKDFSFSFGKI